MFRTLFAAVVALVIAGPAFAQDSPKICDDRAKFVPWLAKKYGETPRVMAPDSRGLLIEVFVSESGSWTLMLSAPTGRSCIRAVGKDWMQFPIPIPGDDS